VDLVYLIFLLVFGAATWGLVRLCQKVS